MNKFYLLLIPLIFVSKSDLLGQDVVKSALFGEHSNYVKTIEGNVYRIFMDMNGDYYPENFISDKEIEVEGKLQLKIWSTEFPKKFSEIAKTYNLIETAYSISNYEILQDSIIAKTSMNINKISNAQQTWLIHGYRKKLYNPEGIHDKTSLYDNQQVRNRIDNHLDNPKSNLTIEVYWDGKYDIFYKGLKSKINLGKIFKNKAIPNANKCGYSLREVFKKINAPEINIISHSTGTHFVTSLLFNKSTNQSFETPSQIIKIALVASASSGSYLFKNYHNRNTNINFKTADNYTIINFYNKKDNVLRKGGFPRRFGVTTLGCNFRNESEKLKKHFELNYPNSTYKEYFANEQPPANHFFWRYTNSPEFTKVLTLLY
jgi:hypothetical protein